MIKESIHSIKKELELLPKDELIALCLRQAKYKLENKEHLSYLLFNANDEPVLIQSIKEKIEDSFNEINDQNTYFIKKSLRKLLRLINKYVKFSQSKTLEIELLIFFCKQMSMREWQEQSLVLTNIYDRQVNRINKTFTKIHEDQRFDYLGEIESL